MFSISFLRFYRGTYFVVFVLEEPHKSATSFAPNILGLHFKFSENIVNFFYITSTRLTQPTQDAGDMTNRTMRISIHSQFHSFSYIHIIVIESAEPHEVLETK